MSSSTELTSSSEADSLPGSPKTPSDFTEQEGTLPCLEHPVRFA